MIIEQEIRDQTAEAYFDQLPFDPYPVQEEALLAWFTNEQGVLVCAPTGTGKTLIAEAAMFEALKLGKTAYYTTPLIALTDQKFREMQDAAVRWGFSADDVGLVTGNRKVNPDAKILVVVAEILLNRLLHHEAFDFRDVWAVVMDEFHSFNDRERGIVWEFGLGLLPKQVKTLLLSATVGNAFEFTNWLGLRHDRRLQLVESTERKVPLSFEWVDDKLLAEQIEFMVQGDEAARRTPALIFCFNREQCWTVAELLKGKKVVAPEQQKALSNAIDEFDWSEGAGPKLKQILQRGVGVHHAGVLPRYRRIVEELFQQKLLSVCVCTETLAAGINLPARSVVMPTLMKGPPRKMKLLEPSSAHQIFGRAGRPQFDDQGFVYVLAHEDDVKISRWREKFDQIPEDTKDPGLLKAKKQLKKKMPKRRENVQYWSKPQFEQLIGASSADLQSRGGLPWRLLAYMLSISAEVEPIRKLVSKRLLDDKGHQQAQKQLVDMLITLWRAGYIQLQPKPPVQEKDDPQQHPESAEELNNNAVAGESPKNILDLGQRKTPVLDLGQKSKSVREAAEALVVAKQLGKDKKGNAIIDNIPNPRALYKPDFAQGTDRLELLLKLRGIHPLYGLFLVNHLGIADRNERIQVLESLLELPRSLGPAIRVPPQDELPPGTLATGRLDEQLLKLGLATAEELGTAKEEDEQLESGHWDDDRVYVLTLAHKLHRLFEYDFPGVHDVRVWPTWVAGELLTYNGDFNKYITSNKLQKQEGLIFRHCLRMVLLIDELSQICPPDIEMDDWQNDLGEIADALEATCRGVDPNSTDQWLDDAKQAKVEM